MPVVKLKRGNDEWLLQVGDEHDTDGKAKNHAMKVANGGGEIMPGNGEAGWTVVSVHPDNDFHEMYGVRNEDLT